MLLNVNGLPYEVTVDPAVELLIVLRDHLELTGSKYGCGEGVCGACTVLLDGKPVRSCITPVSSAIEKEITTIEGLQKGDKLHPVQEAFLETDPFQCAYRASGMIMSAVALLQNNPSPSDNAIVSAMNGNVCRCGTYPNIIASIKKASQAKTTN